MSEAHDNTPEATHSVEFGFPQGEDYEHIEKREFTMPTQECKVNNLCTEERIELTEVVCTD